MWTLDGCPNPSLLGSLPRRLIERRTARFAIEKRGGPTQSKQCLGVFERAGRRGDIADVVVGGWESNVTESIIDCDCNNALL